MKKKKLSLNKLQLNREVIMPLTIAEMNKVIGGAPYPTATCTLYETKAMTIGATIGGASAALTTKK